MLFNRIRKEKAFGWCKFFFLGWKGGGGGVWLVRVVVGGEFFLAP